MSPIRILASSAALSIALLAFLGLVHPGWTPWRAPLGPDDRPIAAQIELAGLDGDTVSSSDLQGDIVVLEFWATWCGPCIDEIADYNALQAEYGGDGVRVVGVAVRSGNSPSVRAFARERGIDYSVLIGDDEVWRDFGPMWGVPTTLLIDRDWRVRRAWIGAGGTKFDELRSSLDALLAESR